jgi:hypothetical protein
LKSLKEQNFNPKPMMTSKRVYNDSRNDAS